MQTPPSAFRFALAIDCVLRRVEFYAEFVFEMLFNRTVTEIENVSAFHIQGGFDGSLFGSLKLRISHQTSNSSTNLAFSWIYWNRSSGFLPIRRSTRSPVSPGSSSSMVTRINFRVFG